MKIAFYRMDWWNPIDWAIALASRGTFTHCEIVISGMVCYSSRIPSGTDYKRIFLKPKKWVVLSLPDTITPTDVDPFCFNELDCGYDYTGVLAFVFKWMKPSKTRWFCSEFCIAALQQAGLYKELDPYKTSPQDFYNYMTK
jgi:hypothetical protein